GIVDRVDQAVTEYDLDTTGFSFTVNGLSTHTFAIDSSIETFTLDENEAGTTTRLRGKPASMQTTVTGWGGNDAFIVGGGDFDFGWANNSTTVTGSNGNDSIEFDDHNDISPPTTTYAMDNLT